MISMAPPPFSSKTGTIEDWLKKLNQRFRLSKVEEEEEKKEFCQFYIGGTAERLVERKINEGCSWEEIQETLIREYGAEDPRRGADQAIENFEKGDLTIKEMGRELEELARKAIPGDEAAAIRRATQAFLQRLKPSLAQEVEKLGLEDYEAIVKKASQLEKWHKGEEKVAPGLANDVLSIKSIVSGIEKSMKENQELLQKKEQVNAPQRETKQESGSSQKKEFDMERLHDVLQLLYPRGAATGREGRESGPRVGSHEYSGRGRTPLRCWLCNKGGHIARDCRERQAFERWRSERGRTNEGRQNRTEGARQREDQGNPRSGPSGPPREDF